MSAWSRRTIALLTSLCVALTGCAQAPPPAATRTPPAVTTWSGSPEDTSPTWATDLDPSSHYNLHKPKGLEPVLKPETRVLTAADAARITAVTITNSDACTAEAEQHPMCQFRITFSSLPDGLAVGAVLNSGVTPTTPSGLLVKVTAIDGTTVSAVQATLSDALAQGEFRIEHEFTADQLRGTPTLAPGVKILPRRSGVLRRSLPGELPAFDAVSLPGELSIDTDIVDGVHLSGTLDFGAGCGLDGGVNGSDIAWMEIGCQAWQSASLKVTAGKDGPVSSARYPVGYFPLAAIPIPIGPVILVVIVDILITVDLSGTVHVGLSYSGHEYAAVRGALRFSIADGLDHDGGVDTSGGGSGGAGKDVSVSAVGRAELRLSLYGVLGISVGGDVSLNFSGGPHQNPRWQLTGNAGITVKMFLGLFAWELSASISYHLKHPFVIATGGNAPPELTLTWPKDGTVLTLTGMLPRKVEATATDVEDGPLPVTWHDAADNVTVQGKGPQSLPFSALGPHLLTVSAVDSDGASAQKTLTVTVQAPSLTLSLQARRIDGSSFGGTPPSGPAGGVILVDAVPKSGQIMPPECSKLSWSASNATVKSDGSCRAQVTLGQEGAAVVRATITDSLGTTADASLSVAVTTPPSTIAPVFLGIDAVANGVHLDSHSQLLGAQPVRVTMTYLNHDQAKVTPRYAWTVTPNGGSPTTLPGGAELLTSSRDFTPPSAWGYKATFTVVITNAATKAILMTRTFTVTWQSLPK